jgi:hypothetical protein
MPRPLPSTGAGSRPAAGRPRPTSQPTDQPADQPTSQPTARQPADGPRAD